MQTPPEGQPPQPPTYYPPQQQQYGPPPYLYPPQAQQPPRKKRRRWPLFALIGVVLLLACIIASVAVSSGSHPAATTTATTATSAATTAATKVHPAQWTTTHTFTGNGGKKTATFSVPDNWKIVWKCNPASFQGIDYNVIITVYNSDGTLADTGVNSLCKKSHTNDSTEIHSSGDVYLDVNSEGDWTIEVQQLKS